MNIPKGITILGTDTIADLIKKAELCISINKDSLVTACNWALQKYEGDFNRVWNVKYHTTRINELQAYVDELRNAIQ